MLLMPTDSFLLHLFRKAVAYVVKLVQLAVRFGVYFLIFQQEHRAEVAIT